MIPIWTLAHSKDFSLTRRLLSADGHVVPDPHAAGTTPMTECSPALYLLG
jgi:hypothetical protein